MIGNYNTFLCQKLCQKGKHLLTVINTDLAEAEALIHKMAKEELQANPDSFAGLMPCVYFKMPYIQPCDSFQELRRLILRVRENTGLRAEFRGIVAIEANQWLGHEREEYFTVMLKYLYDHRDIWRTVMVLNDCKPAQLQRFAAVCAHYMTPNLVHIRLFEDAQVLCGMIQSAFEKRGARISPAAASMLSEALRKPELKEARSLTLIERTEMELIAYSADRPQISEGHVRDYLLDQGTILAMVAGKTLYDERNMNHEQELLYL